MSDDSDSKPDIVSLVSDIKRAIQNAQLQTPDLLVTQADLEIKTTSTAGLRVGGFKWGPVELGGSYTQTQIQTVHMTLTPAPAVIELMSPPTDALTEAIASISAAAREAALAEPRFVLKEATICLNVGIDADGKLTIVVGGEAGSNNVHELKLTVSTKG
jgi:hypothetical protein